MTVNKEVLARMHEKLAKVSLTTYVFYTDKYGYIVDFITEDKELSSHHKNVRLYTNSEGEEVRIDGSFKQRAASNEQAVIFARTHNNNLKGKRKDI